MSFKANIEITSVEEFKKLNEVKVIKEPKIIYKDKIVKVPVEKIVDRIKEVKVKDNSCPICGSDNQLKDNHIWDYPSADGKLYKVVTKNCQNCGNVQTVKAD